MKPKMIIMDLDGTLLRNNKTVSEYTEMVIRECQKRECKIIFATARPERTTLPYVETLKPNAVISNNGAKINCFDGTTQFFAIAPDGVCGIVSQLLDKKMFVCLDYEDYSLTNCPDYKEWGNWNAVYTPDFAEFDSNGVQKVSVRATYFELFSGIDFKSFGCKSYANQSDRWYMITHNEASKLRAIETLSAYYGIPLEDAIAFGDDQNDVEMLQKCNVGVAMENGIDEIKKYADHICPSNEDDGVAKWLEKNIILTI